MELFQTDYHCWYLSGENQRWCDPVSCPVSSAGSAYILIINNTSCWFSSITLYYCICSAFECHKSAFILVQHETLNQINGPISFSVQIPGWPSRDGPQIRLEISRSLLPKIFPEQSLYEGHSYWSHQPTDGAEQFDTQDQGHLTFAATGLKTQTKGDGPTSTFREPLRIRLNSGLANRPRDPSSRRLAAPLFLFSSDTSYCTDPSSTVAWKCTLISSRHFLGFEAASPLPRSLYSSPTLSLVLSPRLDNTVHYDIDRNSTVRG